MEWPPSTAAEKHKKCNLFNGLCFREGGGEFKLDRELQWICVCTIYFIGLAIVKIKTLLDIRVLSLVHFILFSDTPNVSDPRSMENGFIPIDIQHRSIEPKCNTLILKNVYPYGVKV